MCKCISNQETTTLTKGFGQVDVPSLYLSHTHTHFFLRSVYMFVLMPWSASAGTTITCRVSARPWNIWANLRKEKHTCYVQSVRYFSSEIRSVEIWTEAAYSPLTFVQSEFFFHADSLSDFPPLPLLPLVTDPRQHRKQTRLFDQSVCDVLSVSLSLALSISHSPGLYQSKTTLLKHFIKTCDRLQRPA